MKLRLDPQRVLHYCKLSVSELLIQTPGFTYVDSAAGHYAFQDNGASILAVAHCDTVSVKSKAGPMAKKSTVHSPALDDRLGVYLLLEVLPQLGVKMDVLLTDDEEIGRSTAELFDAPEGRKYNWVFSFDRADGEIVMYQYKNMDGDWETFWNTYGFKLGFGSFSDICQLETLGCKGFNFGCGYHKQHTPDCYADLKETAKSVNRFMGFYRAHKDTHFEHTPVPQRSKWDWWEDRAYGKFHKAGAGYDYCDVCGQPEDVKNMRQWGDFQVCDFCYLDMKDYMGVEPEDLDPPATAEEIDDAWYALDEKDYSELPERVRQVAAVHVLPEYYR